MSVTSKSGKTSLGLALLSVIVLLLGNAAYSYAGDGDYDKGVSYLQAGKVAESLKIFESLVETDRTDPYLFYHLGLAYYKSDKPGRAFDAFSKVEELSGKDARDEFRLGVAFYNLGVSYFRKKSYDEARLCFERALKLDPDDGESRYYKGLTEVETGQYDKAVEDLELAAIRKSGDDKALAAVRNAVGMAYYRQGFTAKAVDEFAKTLSIDPENIEALYYMGLLNYKENGYAAARPYFDKIAAKGAPDDKARDELFTTFFNMGVDFQDRDKAEAASDMFGRASALKPSDADAHYYRGYNLMALEKYEDAAAEFKEALALSPGMTKAKSKLDVAGKFAAEKTVQKARSSADSSDWHKALALYTRAVSLDPSSGDAARGMKDASEAVEKDTRERVAKVRALLDGGEYAQAALASRELAKLNPGSAEASALERETASKLGSAIKDILAKAKAAEGRDALFEAASLYDKAAYLNPSDRTSPDSAKRLRARIDGERGRAAKARGEGRLLTAKKSYETLLVYLPGDPDATSGLESVKADMALETTRNRDAARAALDEGDFAKAASLAGSALELTPGDAEGLALKKRIADRARDAVSKLVRDGNAQLDAGDRERAVASFKAALRLDPDSPSARHGIDRAATTPHAASADEEEVRRWYLSGVEHYTKGELEEAITDWREALKLDPGNEKAKSSIDKAEDKLRQTAETPVR